MFSRDRGLIFHMVQSAAKTPARFSYDKAMPQLLASVRSRPVPADVLDAGCGDGRYAAWFHGDCYTGVDLGDNLPKSTSGHTFIKASVLSMPFEDASFDIVLCSLMIEHIPNVPAAIKEIHRVTRPSGVLVLSTATRWAKGIGEMPNLFWKLNRREEGQAFHYFDTADLLQACRSAGFQSAEDLYVGGPWGLGLEYARTFLSCLRMKLLGKRYEHQRNSTARGPTEPPCDDEPRYHHRLRKVWGAVTLLPYFFGNWIAYGLDRLWRSKMAKVVVVVARNVSHTPD